MGKRTAKVGISGKYSVRYGANLRKRVKKLEISSHSRHFCHWCGRFSIRRQAVGIWKCKKCLKTVAGGAWTLATPNSTTIRSTIRRLRELGERK